MSFGKELTVAEQREQPMAHEGTREHTIQRLLLDYNLSNLVYPHGLGGVLTDNQTSKQALEAAYDAGLAAARAEIERLKGKLELLNSFYASDADENENEMLARATKELVESKAEIERLREALTRERLAEWFFNNESDEAEADDRKHKRIPQRYARWPEDAAIQPYCRWAYKRADAFLAYFMAAEALADKEKP